MEHELSNLTINVLAASESFATGFDVRRGMTKGKPKRILYPRQLANTLAVHSHAYIYRRREESDYIRPLPETVGPGDVLYMIEVMTSAFCSLS